jgi:hypothetical protein
MIFGRNLRKKDREEEGNIKGKALGSSTSKAYTSKSVAERFLLAIA